VKRFHLHAIVLGLLFGLAVAYAEAEAARTRLTYYYPTGNRTASGEWPYAGSAACGYAFPLGTVVQLPDRQVRCNDRGGGLEWLHVDVFVRSAAEGQTVARMGAYVNAEVVE
jgi:3D (Asp-Asp-Asp) domain-containing protein